MARFAVVVLLGLCACGFHARPSGDQSPGDVDAASNTPIDAYIDNTSTCVPWAALNVDPCDVSLGPRGPVVIAASAVLDSDTGRLTDASGTVVLPSALIAQTAGPSVRVVNTTTFSIGSTATLSLVGSHPVIFVVHGDATINGNLDAAARGDIPGPRAPGPGGNDATMCGGAIGVDGGDALGAGGGGGAGGGAFGGNGGNGGDGEGAGHGSKGAKGNKIGDATIHPLRGGCRGGVGGDEVGAIVHHGGSAGDGGGAVEITALGQIVITGTIAAGGTGGGASAALVRAGGGGGGSGGAIVIDGDTSHVMATAKLCANGGGGGEGGQLAATAKAGSLATCTLTPAGGGAAQADGGNGGDGGASGTSDGTDGMNGAASAAGGGGGGGSGRIRVRGRTQQIIDSTIVTPAASA